MVGLSIAAALLIAAAPASADVGDGSAFAAKVNLTIPLGSPVNVGPLAVSNTNGPTSASVASLDAGLISAGVMETSAVHDEATGEVKASASTANVKIALGALGGTVGLIQASCSATQGQDQDPITGTSSLANVNLAGITLPLNPAPNTKIDLLGLATLVLNEQIVNPDDGSLTVNAFHLTVNVLGVASGEVIISSATCGPATPPIPLASGAGLWISLGLLGLAAIPISRAIIRHRRAITAP
ncbi:MAG TPA: choice-of-anchor P family protein [Actinophytocola sp.]|uniref:choice-of-anchor P family protein n=1 Tax=Actinophytocola sp. TaxID=1872138 RepID=UPI002DF7C0D4|nr:choice-of-anchor P family protein [Actinophytocola sp.]